MKSFFMPILLVVGILVMVNACTNHETVDPNIENATISFAADVVPLLETYCYFVDQPNACHNVDFASGDFTTHAGTAERSASIANRITTGEAALIMPPSYSPGPFPMSAGEIDTILLWINEGALNN